ncbi:hypothetical protein [Sporosarcina sp.]|uniref:hypothetical protein n=1 Tax=Sporosarcina sp. TaxID=49982 RepID=UPI00261DD578|nr:hypothetical protein [Sporosarcina sp.]
MIKDLLRSVGIGCLIAGGTLYAVSNMPPAEENSLEKELADTKEELKVVKKELAISQTVTLDETPTQKPDTDAAKEQTTEPKTNEEKEPEDKEIETTVVTKKVSVKPGSNSSDLSSTLERAHIIEDAAKFDNYMKDYGYALKIQIGTFELSSNMTFKEIAEILTK